MAITSIIGISLKWLREHKNVSKVENYLSIANVYRFFGFTLFFPLCFLFVESCDIKWNANIHCLFFRARKNRRWEGKFSVINLFDNFCWTNLTTVNCHFHKEQKIVWYIHYLLVRMKKKLFKFSFHPRIYLFALSELEWYEFVFLPVPTSLAVSLLSEKLLVANFHQLNAVRGKFELLICERLRAAVR